MGYITETHPVLHANAMWGDGPQDEIDDGLTNLIRTFTRDMGRLPTRDEVLLHVMMHLRTLTLPETPAEPIGLDSPFSYASISNDDVERLVESTKDRDHDDTSNLHATVAVLERAVLIEQDNTFGMDALIQEQRG